MIRAARRGACRSHVSGVYSQDPVDSHGIDKLRAVRASSIVRLLTEAQNASLLL